MAAVVVVLVLLDLILVLEALVVARAVRVVQRPVVALRQIKVQDLLIIASLILY